MYILIDVAKLRKFSQMEEDLEIFISKSIEKGLGDKKRYQKWGDIHITFTFWHIYA